MHLLGLNRGLGGLKVIASMTDAEVTLEYLCDQVWIVGSPETVARKIAGAVTDLDVGRFDLIYSSGSQPASARMHAVELYGTKVIPMVRDLLAEGTALVPGMYRLIFDTQRYFEAQSLRGFYPHVIVVFEATPGEVHYHVPLLLGPFGYTTYRGS